MKRLFDLFVSSSALCLAGPVLLIATCLIKREDGGDIFFVQERLGRGQRPFQVWKLRTMRDGEVTSIGRWLRDTALDEFTQFWHVWRGEMSVVGPRPMTQADIERLGWTDQRARWQVKPGVTGLVQVFGGLDAETSAKLETLYADHHSFSLDTKIILWSAAINVFGKRRIRSKLRDITIAAGLSLCDLQSL